MNLKAAITGNLRAYLQQQKNQAEVAVTNGIKEIATNIKTDLRTQVLNAGLGNKLAKTWQAKFYPKHQKSISAAGVVTSRATKIIRAFNDGVVIKSLRGAFLAIPTEHAPKRGLNNKRISPSNFPEHRYGKLRFIYVNGQMSLLVVNKPSRSKRKNAEPKSVVMFILIPQVKMKKKLDYMVAVNKWLPQIPAAILSNWK